ncbi:hypothetical protein [Pantoea sp. C8B4]|uniref:hypothetical protein n=1 Tax=Pantoea sp. C8B4 TaxID=3243083 RepID=UPI00073ED7F2|nr:hypothetical protein [Type-E symbiont of Plautia stali]
MQPEQTQSYSYSSKDEVDSMLLDMSKDPTIWNLDEVTRRSHMHLFDTEELREYFLIKGKQMLGE